MEKVLPDSTSLENSRTYPVLDKIIQVSLFTFVAFSMFSISVTQISFALGALAWLLKTHLTKSWKELRGTWVGMAVLCFFLAGVLSIISSVDFEGSLKLMKKLLQFIILFWVANSVQDEKQRDLLFKLVIIAGVITAFNGLLPMVDPSLFLPGKLYGASRPIGTLSVPATFSGVLMLIGLVTLGRFLFHKPREYLVLGSLGVVGLCLLLSMTRQAWLGFFIGTIFLLFFWNKKFLLLIPLLLAGLLLFSPDKIQNRLFSFKNFKEGSFQARVFSWKGGWEIFKNHPATGCGYKCVDTIHSQYPDPSGFIARFRGMHSNLFQLLIDTGIVGLMTWFSIWVAYFFEIFKRCRPLNREKSQENTGILMGCSAAVLAYLVGGFFETSIYDSEVSMLLYFLMGLSLAQVKKVSTVE